MNTNFLVKEFEAIWEGTAVMGDESFPIKLGRHKLSDYYPSTPYVLQRTISEPLNGEVTEYLLTPIGFTMLFSGPEDATQFLSDAGCVVEIMII